MTELSTFLRPADVARLGRLEIIARELVEGFIKGLHLSPAKGSSTEFAEHRPYACGDEIRRIDWRTFARTDRYYLKEYDDETNVRATLILDSSESMAYPEADITKFQYAKFLAAALGYLLLRQRDGIGLAVIHSRIQHYLPPRATAQHLGGIFRTLSDIEPEGPTDLAVTLGQIASHGRSRNLMIILSDFLDDPEKILRGVAQLRHRGCEVIALRIVDPSEADFPFTNWTVFRDPEDDTRRLRIDARQLREIYRDNLAAHQEALKKGCTAAQVDYSVLQTDTPFEVGLATFLDRRNRLR